MLDLGLNQDSMLTMASLIVAVVIALLGFPGIYNKWQERKKEKELKSQLESSIRDADALSDSGEYTEAINRYDGVLKTISPQKYPYQWGNCKNSIGMAYYNLSLINNQELNIKRGIQAYQEALMVYTIDRYPINYAITQNNLGGAYVALSEIRGKEDPEWKRLSMHTKTL